MDAVELIEGLQHLIETGRDGRVVVRVFPARGETWSVYYKARKVEVDDVDGDVVIYADQEIEPA
jgi:hypothetical protein